VEAAVHARVHKYASDFGYSLGVIADMLSTDGTYVVHVDGACTLAVSKVFGPNVHFSFDPGAWITVNAGCSLTIDSPGHIAGSPTQKVFVLVGTGEVAFAKGGEISAQWWGVSPDETASHNATCMNQALACAFANSCDVAVYGSAQAAIPCRQIRYIPSGAKRGVRIRGVGRPVFDFTGLTTAAIAAYSSAGRGLIQADCTARHGFSTGDAVSIQGSVHYDGIHVVTVLDSDSFTFSDTWVSDAAAGKASLVAWAINADAPESGTNIIQEHLVLENLILEGPERNGKEPYCWTDGITDTATVGLDLEWVLDAYCRDVEIRHFSTAYYARRSYIANVACHFHRSRIGCHLDHGCTLGEHSGRTSYDTNWIGLKATGSVYTQNLIGVLLQSCRLAGIVCAPGPGCAQTGWQIINPYFESCGDGIRLCRREDDADSDGWCFGYVISGGTWSAFTGSPLKFEPAGGGDVHGISLIEIPAIAAPGDIVGHLSNSKVLAHSMNGVGAVPQVLWIYDRTGTVRYPVYGLSDDCVPSLKVRDGITTGTLFLAEGSGDGSNYIKMQPPVMDSNYTASSGTLVLDDGANRRVTLVFKAGVLVSAITSSSSGATATWTAD
jgi:hypothetical protein